MLRFLKRIFSARNAPIVDPDISPEEFWQTDFSKPARSRFLDETGDSYSARISQAGLTLAFEKKNVYAWTINPIYQYKDFILEALLKFPESKNSRTGALTPDGSTATLSCAGSMSAGFLFRYQGESTFYGVLLSDEGLIRMDAVVNGTPMPILGWTEIRKTETGEAFKDVEAPPYITNPSVYSLRIISQGTSFTIIVNDAWIAECADDTIQSSGRVAFAGQNWAKADKTEAILKAIAIDSRPVEIETIQTRWNQYIKIPPEAHINLARTWFAMGRYVPAILELKRAWKGRKPGTEELLLSGQAYLAQRLLPEAEEQVRKALSIEANNEQAAADLGGILYLQNRFIELEDLLNTLSRESIEQSAFIANLEGHLLNWKGRHEDAAKAYHRASLLQKNQGLFFLHEGNEWKAAGKSEEATVAWLEAARLFLGDESYDDLAEVIRLLEEASPGDPRAAGITGKYLYATDRPEEALEKLETAIRADAPDSSVWYIYGMLIASKSLSQSITALRKAVELESAYGPYHFRLAETLFFAGEDCDSELEKAIAADGDNGWAYNLAALKALGENNLDAAKAHILEARKKLPDEISVLINFAEICRRTGVLDEALPLLDTDNPDALRAGANLLVEDRRFEEAEAWYIKSLRYRPFDAGTLTDRAANCLELDMLNEADDLLGRALDIETSPRIYQLISYLAGRKGEFARSEVALQQGLSEFPDNPDLLYELSGVYLATKRPKKAAEIAVRLRNAEDSERSDLLDEEISETNTNKIDCFSCGRVWCVPKDIPAQGSLHLTAQPPDELPAGTCPECMKTYCIGCAKEALGEDGRFRCKTCGAKLKLIDQNAIYILSKWQETQD